MCDKWKGMTWELHLAEKDYTVHSITAFVCVVYNQGNLIVKHLLIIAICSLAYSQLASAHRAPLNAVGCHLKHGSTKHHCHKNENFQVETAKKTSFSGLENQAPEEKYYNKKLVKSIQVQLTLAGFDVGSADGIYGAKTRQAIYAFQKNNAFRVTGRPSDYVLSKLRDFNRLKKAK